jgi:hypothetical protein
MTGFWDFVQQGHNFIALRQANHVKLGVRLRKRRFRRTSWQSTVQALIDGTASRRMNRFLFVRHWRFFSFP